MLSEAVEGATRTLRSRRPAYDRLVAELLAHETVERVALEKVLGDRA